MNKMKIVAVIGLALLFTLTVNAQRNNERMKSMQIAFITEEINLTPKQAEVFWPIHNEGTQRTESIREEIKNLDNNVDDYFRLEKELYESNRSMMESLRSVITDEQLMLLVKAGEKFKKRVLNQIKQSRKRRRKAK